MSGFLLELETRTFRLKHWKELLQGDRLFTELCALHPYKLPEVVRILGQCSNDPLLKLQPEQKAALTVVLVCAQIAWLDSFSYDRLPGLLAQIDPAVELPGDLVAALEKTSPDRWAGTLRASLRYVHWLPPLCAAWGWDAIHRLQQKERSVAQRQRITLLLVDGKHQGVAADLTLELLPKGGGEIYPDPGSMWHPVQRQAFRQSVQDALAFVNKQGLVLEKQDVRWCVSRQDGGPLDVLDGKSAGAAFALALAKLLSGS